MSELSTMQGAALERTPQRIGEEIRSLTYQAKCMTVYFGVEIGRRPRSWWGTAAGGISCRTRRSSLRPRLPVL